MRPEPTENEMRQAFEHLRSRRPNEWPADFDEAMAHPTLSRLVRITAMHPPGALRSKPLRAAAPIRDFDDEPPMQLAQPRRQGFAGIDRKRAAAGDRDDD